MIGNLSRFDLIFNALIILKFFSKTYKNINFDVSGFAGMGSKALETLELKK